MKGEQVQSGIRFFQVPLTLFAFYFVINRATHTGAHLANWDLLLLVGLPAVVAVGAWALITWRPRLDTTLDVLGAAARLVGIVWAIVAGGSASLITFLAGVLFQWLYEMSSGLRSMPPRAARKDLAGSFCHLVALALVGFAGSALCSGAIDLTTGLVIGAGIEGILVAISVIRTWTTAAQPPPPSVYERRSVMLWVAALILTGALLLALGLLTRDIAREFTRWGFPAELETARIFASLFLGLLGVIFALGSWVVSRPDKRAFAQVRLSA